MNYDGFIYCCKKCPNCSISFDYCYNGKSGNECPAYQLENKPENKPPKDIANMLEVK